MSDEKPKKNVKIRGTNRYHFRTGLWADLISIVPYYKDDGTSVECYFVRFADGALDFWPVADVAVGYEFKGLT